MEVANPADSKEEYQIDSQNRIERIGPHELSCIFNKLNSNAFPYEQNQRERIMSSLNEGNQLNTEDINYIFYTYREHINELFSEIPKEANSTWIIPFTVIYVVLGIVFRILVNSESHTVLLYMGFANILAAGVALFSLREKINHEVSSWIDESVFLDKEKRRIFGSYKKKKRLINFIIYGAIIAIVIVEILLYVKDQISVGNDAISIVAFGIAFFSNNVETYFIRKIELQLREIEL